ncbi:MAG: arginine--tRNA ligase [Proteobacteria bacterium]|nr:arginine--tRNA ligase [Pseudomonadota bacterium]
MNIFNNLKQELEKLILLLAKQEAVEISDKQLAAFTVEPCKDKAHGDVATNIAMVFCKSFKTNPRALAQKLIPHLQQNPVIKNIEIAGAGFINIIFDEKIWQDFLLAVLSEKKYSLPNLSDGKKVNMEYASPNPTGPMHVGHTRGAIYGDVLANLLEKTGFDITREYYINDAGSQILTLVKSAYLRYLESLGEKITIPEGLYPGEYLKPIGQKLKDQYQDTLKGMDEEEYIPLIRDFVVNAMMEMIREDLALLGIKHDKFFSEKKELHDKNKIDAAVKALEAKGLIYKGIIEPPKGKTAEDYSQEEQLLFKSTDFGDDIDRVVQTADGRYTYFAADIAYSLNKFERGAQKMILALGFDHAGYVKRLKAATKAITDGKAQTETILCQMVKFVKDGNPLKMSKRSGNFITAREVTEEVGADVIRFTMLTRKNDAPFDFDLTRVLEQSKDNPVFYVQYAHARCHSVLRNLKEQLPELADIINQPIDATLLANLKREEEIELIKKLASYPRVVEMAVTSYEPHRIAFYLQELAAMFHALWNKGMEDPSLKFIIKDDINLTKSRIYLVMATIQTIASAFDIFNIAPLEEMR